MSAKAQRKAKRQKQGKQNRKQYGKQAQGENYPPHWREAGKGETPRPSLSSQPPPPLRGAGLFQGAPRSPQLSSSQGWANPAADPMVGMSALYRKMLQTPIYSGQSGSSGVWGFSLEASEEGYEYTSSGLVTALVSKTPNKGGLNPMGMNPKDVQLLEPLPFKYSDEEANKMPFVIKGNNHLIDLLSDEYNEYFAATTHRIEVRYSSSEVIKLHQTATPGLQSTGPTDIFLSSHGPSPSILHHTDNSNYPFSGATAAFALYDCGESDEGGCLLCEDVDTLPWEPTTKKLRRPQKQSLLHKYNFLAQGHADPLFRVLSNYRTMALLYVKSSHGQDVTVPIFFWPEERGPTVHVAAMISPPGWDAAVPVYVDTYSRDSITRKLLANGVADAVVAAADVTPFIWQCKGCYVPYDSPKYRNNKERLAVIAGTMCTSCIIESANTGISPSGAIPQI